MPMYNLIEYSDNYSDTGNLWQFKRDEQNMNNGITVDITINDSKFFKYKSSFLPTADNNGLFKNVRIAVPLKYLSNF